MPLPSLVFQPKRSTSPRCQCRDDAFPDLLAHIWPPAIKELAPYIQGCIAPLSAANLTRVANEVFITITKEPNGPNFQDVDVTVSLEGTAWNHWHRGVSSMASPQSYEYEVVNSTASWLQIPEASGRLYRPANLGSNASTTIRIHLSALGVPSMVDAYQTSLDVRVKLPELADGSDGTLLPSPSSLSSTSISIPVRLLVHAKISVPHCTLDDGWPDILPSTIHTATHLFSFTARDIDGDPLVEGGNRFNISVTCDISSSSSSAHRCGGGGGGGGGDDAPPSANSMYQGNGRYTVHILVSNLGDYLVRVYWIDPMSHEQDPLPFVQKLRAVCPRGQFSMLPVNVSKCHPCTKEQLTDKIACAATDPVPTTNVTIETLTLMPGVWRLSPWTTDLHNCTPRNGFSPCTGGQGIVDDVTNYCIEGSKGPLCKLCVKAGHFYDTDDNKCTPCLASGPKAAVYASMISIGIAMIVLLFVAVTIIIVVTYERLTNALNWLLFTWQRLGLTSKIKISVGYYQVISAMPIVFDITYPRYYKAENAIIQFLAFDWIFDAFTDASCIGGFAVQLIWTATSPLILISVFMVGKVTAPCYMPHAFPMS